MSERGVEDRAERSIALLDARVSELPALLARAATAAPVELDGVEARDRWTVTGVGASEGPARLFASLLVELGLSASFLPLSTFAMSAVDGDVLVVFSQQLSPNARLALAARRAFRTTVLVTTLSPERDRTVARLATGGVRINVHEPTDESGFLLRVQGPAVANLVALRLAVSVAQSTGLPAPAWAQAMARVGPALATATARARGVAAASSLHGGAVALVAAGRDVARCEGLRHKLVEGLGRADPALWDVCGIVHGPLQSFFSHEATLLTLEHDDDGRERGLFDRLAEIVSPSRHALVRLSSSLPGPLGLLEHDLLLDELLVRSLRARPRDLAEWPAKNHDRPIYELGADALGDEPDEAP